MAKDTPAVAFTPADAEESLGKVGAQMLARWAREANQSLWTCMADGGEEAACRGLAKTHADVCCKRDSYIYAAGAEPPEGVEVHRFAGGWAERRDHGQTIRNVEVFRVGKWNGETYTAADLDAMVKAFGEVGFSPPVKLGHTDEPEAPAYGWVRNLRREGDVLKADFEDLPDETYQAIAEGRYDAVSAEIYFGMERDKKKFPRVLGAVAILGAHPPGVSGLKPLRASMAGLALAATATRHVYTLSKEQPRMSDKPATDPAGKGAGGDDIEAMRKQLADLQAENAKLQADAKGRADHAVQIERMAERLKELERATAEAQEARRVAEVRAKADACPIPALRPHFLALYDLASRAAAGERVERVKFSIRGDDGKEQLTETEPVAVLDRLIEHVQKLGKGLLREHAAGGDLNRGPGAAGDDEEDPGIAFDRLVKAEMAASKTDYATAMQAVRRNPAHRTIVERYAARAH